MLNETKICLALMIMNTKWQYATNSIKELLMKNICIKVKSGFCKNSIKYTALKV